MNFELKQLIPYLTAGDPDLEITAKYLNALEQSPVKIVELGIPFSDPLADGPVIQASHQRAIAGGTNLSKVFALLSQRTQGLSRSSQQAKADHLPLQIIFMLDYNLIIHHGIDAFVIDCTHAGVAGVLSPNCPISNPHGLNKKLLAAGIADIHLVSQSTPIERMKKIAAHSSGFLYVLSTTGVTGARDTVSSSARQTVEKLRAITRLPLCVGFGISTPEHVKEVFSYADGAVVGSALVSYLKDSSQKQSALTEWLRRFKV